MCTFRYGVYTKAEVSVSILVVINAPLFRFIFLSEVIFWPKPSYLLRFKDESDQLIARKLVSDVMNFISDVRAIPFACVASKMTCNSFFNVDGLAYINYLTVRIQKIIYTCTRG